MKVPKGYYFDCVIDYEDYADFYYKNDIGEFKVYREYRPKNKNIQKNKNVRKGRCENELNRKETNK